MRPRRHSLALTALALAALAPGAWANYVLPGQFGMMANAWLALLTFGLSFCAVTLIEGLIIKPLLQVHVHPKRCGSRWS